MYHAIDTFKQMQDVSATNNLTIIDLNVRNIHGDDIYLS